MNKKCSKIHDVDLVVDFEKVEAQKERRKREYKKLKK